MRSVVDRNVFTLRIPVFISDGMFKDSLLYVPYDKDNYAINPS